MKPKFRNLLFSLCTGLAVTSTQAATHTFTVPDAFTTGTGNWSTDAKWNTVPVSDPTTSLVFTLQATGNSQVQTTGAVNDIANPFQLNTLTFNSNPSAGNGSSIVALNISGSPLEFVSNGPTTPVINLNGNRTAGQPVQFNVSSNLVLTNNTLFTGNGTAAFTVSGGISGAGNFTKGGTSKLTLSGTNAYDGTTTISGGILQFTNAASLYNNNTVAGGWTATNIKVANGGILALNVGGAGQFTAANVNTLLTNLSGANGSSTTGFAAGSTLGLDTTGASTTVSGNIVDSTGTGGGALNVTKLGTNTLTLSGANTYTGNTSILQGNLTLAPTAGGMTLGAITATTGGTTNIAAAGNITLTLGGAGTNSITSITETSNANQQLNFTKNTAATWSVGNVNVRQGNTHTVSAGILKLNGTFEWASTNFDRVITVSSTGQLDYNNAGALKTSNGRLRMTGGSMDNTSLAAITTSTHNPGLELAGDWTFIGSNGADSNLNFGTGIVRITGTSGTNRTINVQNANTQLTLGGVISSFTLWNNGNAVPNVPAANGLIKAGAGTLELGGVNSYTGATAVNQGTLVVSGTGSINSSSSLTISSGATFRYNSSTALTVSSITNSGTIAGTGNLNGITLGGTGSVDPGNSPGILTAAATDPTAGLDYNFEFTNATVPTWSNATASVNDVLRLTSATPFTAGLTTANILSVYFNVGSLSGGNVFTGGFYTDNNADFLSSIENASFNYYLANVGGAVTYNGINYDLYTGPLGISFGTVQVGSADFAGGTITDGYVTQFTVVPEPNVAALLGGLGAMLLLRRRR
jgi:autotransporter-associated beta strand protein